MSKVRFEYILKYSTIKSDNENLDIAKLPLPRWRGFAIISVRAAPDDQKTDLITTATDKAKTKAL